MDTEKKVQFVALTKEEIDAMIQQAALAGAQVASDAMMVGQRKSEKEKIDRRLHNTDLLLRNYFKGELRKCRLQVQGRGGYRGAGRHHDHER